MNPTNQPFRAFKNLKDGRIASASYDNAIRFWNTTTYSLIYTISSAHSNFIYSFELLSNGNCLLSGAADNKIKMWNTTSYTLIRTLTSTSIIYFIQLLANGNLASASSFNAIIWNMNSYTSVLTLVGHTDRVTVLELLTDGTLLSGSFDKTVKVWNITDGTIVNSFSPCNQAVYYVKLLINGILAIGGNASLTFVKISGPDYIPITQASSSLNLLPSLAVYSIDNVNIDVLAIGMSNGNVMLINTSNYSKIIEFGPNNSANPMWCMEVVTSSKYKRA
jgi:WD40 repeat protein